MTIYKVKRTYIENDEIIYNVMPYNLKGTLKCFGFIKFIKFLHHCRLSKKAAVVLAIKLADKLNNVSKW